MYSQGENIATDDLNSSGNLGLLELFQLAGAGEGVC